MDRDALGPVGHLVLYNVPFYPLLGHFINGTYAVFCNPVWLLVSSRFFQWLNR